MDLVNIMDSAFLGKTTKKIPFIDGAEVSFLNDVPGNFIEQLNAKSKELGDQEAGYWSASQVIIDWNLSDGKKKLQIAPATLKKLPLKVQKWIFKNSTDSILTDEERKKG